jgi:uncharacterized protein YcfJ
VVRSGNWQVCQDADFNGRCVVLRPGEYRSLADVGLEKNISSVRRVEDGYGSNGGRDDRAYVAQGNDRDNGAREHDYRRRADERLIEVPVTSVHAVVGPPEQRCWIERRDYESNANVPGAIAGGVIGGILGHQIGGGHGRDVATIGGAVAGAAIGANVGGDDRGSYGRDVQRCTSAPQYDRPDFWDVTYSFRGQEHHVQMTSPPGPTITINADGEPRL